MPAFKVGGKAVAGYAHFTRHCSYFPHSGSVLPRLADELKGREWSKGTLKFSVDEPLPVDLLARLVAIRLEEVGLAVAPSLARAAGLDLNPEGVGPSVGASRRLAWAASGGGAQRMAVRLAILDVNGTLSVLDPVAERLAEVGLEGMFEVWFARILRDGFAAAAAGTFAAFGDLAVDHLRSLLEQHGLDAADGPVEHVIGGFDRVPAHPDVAAGLGRLADAGVVVVTMTNGTVAITRSLLEREGLAGLVEATYDVEMAGRWKPAPEAYRYVLARHDVVPSEAAMIAVHPWDLHGAAAVGLATGWVDRTGARYPEPLTSPTVRGPSLEAVVDALLA